MLGNGNEASCSFLSFFLSSSLRPHLSSVIVVYN